MGLNVDGNLESLLKTEQMESRSMYMHSNFKRFISLFNHMFPSNSFFHSCLFHQNDCCLFDQHAKCCRLCDNLLIMTIQLLVILVTVMLISVSERTTFGDGVQLICFV